MKMFSVKISSFYRYFSYSGNCKSQIILSFSFICLVFARVLKKTDIRRSWFHLHGYPQKMRLQRRPKGLLNGPPKTKLLVCAAVICSAMVKEKV